MVTRLVLVLSLLWAGAALAAESHGAGEGGESRPGTAETCERELQACRARLAKQTALRANRKYACAGLCELKPGGIFVESKFRFFITTSYSASSAFVELEQRCHDSVTGAEPYAYLFPMGGINVSASTANNCRRLDPAAESAAAEPPWTGRCGIDLPKCRGAVAASSDQSFQKICAVGCFASKWKSSSHDFLFTHAETAKRALLLAEPKCAAQATELGYDYSKLTGHHPFPGNPATPINEGENCR